MIFNAQAHAQFHAQPPVVLPQRRGTPPQQQSDFYRSAAPDQHTFHPYAPPTRRPARQAEPYARTDAAGSSSSVNSASSSARSRKGSNPSVPDVRRPVKPSPLGQTHRPTSSGTIRPASPPTPRQSTSTASTTASTATTATSVTSISHVKRLSISKDDSQLGDPVAVPSASMVRSGGLKGRLRRALSFNAASTLDESPEPDDKLNSRRKALANASKVNAAANAAAAATSTSAHDDVSPPGSPTTPTGPTPPPPAEPSIKGKSRARRAASLFNTKLNASTDNISLSSTVSSASVMIRKLGSMGRLARKNSLMGITSLFKDKDKDRDASGKDKGKKGATAVASVTHATAEIDRAGSSSDGPEISGLSPAARLARQHTIRSNEEAARQKAAEEARARDAAVAAASAAGGVGGAPVPVWERGTAPRGARRSGIREGDEVEEEGAGSDREGSESDSGSEEGTYEGHREQRGWDDDEEDVTIRVGGPVPHAHAHREEEDPWAIGLRRSIERTRRPAKGILKSASFSLSHTTRILISFTRRILI